MLVLEKSCWIFQLRIHIKGKHEPGSSNCRKTSQGNGWLTEKNSLMTGDNSPVVMDSNPFIDYSRKNWTKIKFHEFPPDR